MLASTLYIQSIHQIYVMAMTSHCHMAGFHARLQARPDPPQCDMPDGHRPDHDDTADFELPDQQALIDAFTAGHCKASQHDFSSFSTLLSTMPAPSLSHGHVKAKNETVQACHEIQMDSGRIDCHNQFDQVNRLHSRRRKGRSAQACGSDYHKGAFQESQHA